MVACSMAGHPDRPGSSAMGRTAFGGRNSPWSTSAPATFAPVGCCWGTRSWKVPHVTSALKLMMLW